MAVARHAAADPDHRGHVVLDARPPGRGADERRAGRRLHPGIQHGADRRRSPRRRCGERGAQHRASRSVARSGTALLNTVFAGAVTAYLDRQPDRSSRRSSGRPGGAHPRLPRGVLLGRGLLFCALLVAIFVINAKKDDVPTEPGMAVARRQPGHDHPVTNGSPWPRGTVRGHRRAAASPKAAAARSTPPSRPCSSRWSTSQASCR